MRYGRLAWFTMFVFLAACTPPENVPETLGGSESANLPDAFVGSWTLVSWTRTDGNGETTYPYGKDAFGRIAYLPNGKMAAILMRRQRPAVSSDRASELTLEERSAITTGFFAYSGTYTVNEGEGTVTHHVEACLNPNWVGNDRVRTFERIGEHRIMLRTTERSPPSELIWQREE